MNDVTHAQLMAIRNDMHMNIAHMKREILSLESHVMCITDVITSNCKHNMVIDHDSIEPCSPTPYICTKCRYSY
jgi:hypothetical protein